METQADIKPGDTLTIGIKDQTENVMHFKIKTTTKFEKVFKAFAERRSVDIKACRFLLDGQRVKEHETPASLDLKDFDTIDCLLEQTGGGNE